MIKTCMILLSFLFSNVFDIKDNYAIAIEESVEEEIIDNKYDINLYKNEGMYVLKSDEVTLTFENNSNDFDYVVSDNKIYVLLYEDDYYLCKYSLDGKIIGKEKVIDMLNINKSLENVFLKATDNDIYILGTITNGDVFIVSVNNMKYKIYQSEKYEKLEAIDLYEENGKLKIYMYIEKDKISEFPFGNGSNKIIVKVNEEFGIEKITYLMDETFSKMFIEGDYLFLITSQKIKIYDTNLNFISKTEKSEESVVFSGKNGLLIVFDGNHTYLVEQSTLEKIKEISELDFLNVKKFEKTFYSYEDGIATYFDIIDLTKMVILEEGLTDYEDTTSVYSCFGKCESMGRTYDTYFDKAVFGKYEGVEEYKAVGGIIFSVNFCYNIKPLTNVTQGGVYAEGYHLLYNGKGTLDGKAIYNNEPCYGAGMHTLVVEGNNDSYTVSFYLSDKQIEFDTLLSTKGKEFKTGEEYYIEIRFYNDEKYSDYEIDRINIMYEEYKRFTYDNGLLRIYFKPENKVIDKEIFLKSVVFKYEGNKYTVFIGKLFHINIISDNLLVNGNYEPNQNFVRFVTQDNDKLTRMFTIKLIDETNEYTKSYGIYSQDITIDNLINKTYKMELYITYNAGVNVLKEKKILEGYVTPKKQKIGYIRINKYQESLQDFSVSFEEESLYNLSYDGKTIYEASDNSTEKIIIYSVMSFAISFAICKTVRWILRRKRKTI